MPLAEWQKSGRNTGSIIADPMFVNAARDDFRFRRDSPARRIGFKPFNYTQAGVYGSADWKRLATSHRYPAFEIAPGPPPLAITNDFGSGYARSHVSGATVCVENKGDSITVTDETAATGRQSLKITDAPGLEHRYNLHFYFSPSYTDGVAQWEFDLRIESGAEFLHEWHDNNHPYRVEPSLSVVGAKLLVSGKQLLTLPTGRWIRFQISSGVGNKSTGILELVVNVPGHPRHASSAVCTVTRNGSGLTGSALSATRTPTRSFTWIT